MFNCCVIYLIKSCFLCYVVDVKCVIKCRCKFVFVV
nr:MAG TPA: hypothetical protein [Caudoviricetes sp.]